jgi:hypothetical protein
MRQQKTPTPDRHIRLWQHPAYLAIWERLPYGLQIRLIELEARFDRAFKRRLRVKRRDVVNGLQRAVLIALIAAAARGIVLLMRHR